MKILFNFFNFIRRPSFSPDGNLIITPTGIHRPPPSDKQSVSSDNSLNSFCTHIYTRDQLTTPAVSLVGLEDPSVGIRFSPIIYNLVQSNGNNDNPPSCLFKGKYRYNNIFNIIFYKLIFN
jgi:chromatin assembly factor 1 subunit B